jgi:hypothetical protein
MIFFGDVSPAGLLELDHSKLYSDLLKGRLANCRVKLDIDRKKTPRSQQQSAYLWAAVYRRLRNTPEIPSQKFKKFVSRCFCRLARCRSATGW